MVYPYQVLAYCGPHDIFEVRSITDASRKTMTRSAGIIMKVRSMNVPSSTYMGGGGAAPDGALR